MKISTLALLGALALQPMLPMHAAAAPASATAVDAAHLKVVEQMMAAMQAEKKMRNTVWTSRFRTEEVKKTTAEKFEQVPVPRLYRELATRSLPHISKETAIEMTRFYESNYGKKVVHAMYNNSAALNPTGGPRPSAADQKIISSPAFQKANDALLAAEPELRKIRLALLMDIANNRFR